MPETYTTVPMNPEAGGAQSDGDVPRKKSSAERGPKKSSVYRHHHSYRPCEKCGHVNQPTYLYPMEIYPPPRPADRIRPDNKNFIGYIILLAIVIFLFYVAVKFQQVYV